MAKSFQIKALLKSSVLSLVLVLTACSTLSSDVSRIMADEAKELLPLQIYLVRHAEKKLDVKNPSLTAAGQERSIELMRTLADIPLDKIYSSDYRRTIETAEPTAAFFGLDIEHYDPRALPNFSDQLKAQFGVILVVGHSNTTPQLVELLGGDSISEIDEASEYDRLYHIAYDDDGTVMSKLLRYGKPYTKNQ